MLEGEGAVLDSAAAALLREGRPSPATHVCVRLRKRVMGDALPRPTRGSLPEGPHATPLSAPHPTPTRRRADTCTRVSRRCPCTAAVASQRMPRRSTAGGNPLLQVLPGTSALAFGTKAPVPSRGKSRSWAAVLGGMTATRGGGRTRSPENETPPPPRARPDARAKAPVWRVRAREGVSVGVNGQRPHARCAAPSSGTNIPLSTRHATLHLHTTFGLPWGGGSHPRVRARSYRRAYERKGCPYAPRVNPVDHT